MKNKVNALIPSKQTDNTKILISDSWKVNLIMHLLHCSYITIGGSYVTSKFTSL